MALDFPSSPTNGQVYQNYYYDGPTGAWRSLSSTVNPIPSTLKNLTISSTETTGVSLKVTPFTTSSVNLQEWYNTSSTVVASMNVAGDLTANELNLTGTEINGDSKTIARYSDAWLRLNPDQDFTSGIYTNTSLIRTDNGLQVGANGANFLATSSALTHNGTDILKKDMRQYYPVGNVGTGTAANYYEVFTWTVGSIYQNFSAEIKINGRGNTDAAYTVHARGEYSTSTWGVEVLNVYSETALPDGDTWILVFSDINKTAKLYYRRTGNDWNDRSLNFSTHWLSGATPVYSNTLFGTTAPTGDAVITKTVPDPISVISGGTGATTLTSGGYLKGAGTGAITSQTGIPAGDITSGQLSRSRMPAGSVLQVLSKSDTVDYSAGVSTNTWIAWPGSRMNLSITPTSTSSKILIIVNADLGNISNDAAFRILRDGTAIGVGGSYSGKQQASGVTGMLYSTDSNHTRRVVTVSYLDSPATTSSVSYDVQFSSEGGTMYINRAPATSYQNGTYIFAATGVSTITLMEVAG